MKKLIIIVGILAIAGFLYLTQKSSSEIVNNKPQGDYKNVAYTIEGQKVLLKNGTAETTPEDEEGEMIETEYFGNEVKGDFNNDGTEDIAFVLIQNPGGTGVFYYIVAALKTSTGYKGTNAVLLGDRIAPQTTEFRNGKIIVNYADRKPDEPYSAEPSIGVSKYFKVSGNKLIEVSP